MKNPVSDRLTSEDEFVEHAIQAHPVEMLPERAQILKFFQSSSQERVTRGGDFNDGDTSDSYEKRLLFVRRRGWLESGEEGQGLVGFRIVRNIPKGRKR